MTSSRQGVSARRRRWRETWLEQLEPRCLLAVDYSPSYRLRALDGLSPQATAAPVGLTPTQIRHAYGFDQILFGAGNIIGNGSGQTIAIVDAYHAPTIQSDLHAFDLAFGLPDPPSFIQVSQNGSTNFPPVDPVGPGAAGGSWELETALDVEWAHALAPGANILLVEANSPSNTDLIQAAVNFARSQPGVVAVSMSFGGGEFSGETFYDTYFTTPAGHAGVTFLAASGDDGQPSGYPAFSPNVVAVGGTTLSVDAAGNYLGETGWSGSGGSVSTSELQPSYQVGVVTQSSSRRANPDVAFDANPNSGVPVYDSYDFGAVTPWTQVGGTSFSAPAWAALIAIADQGRALFSLGSLDGRTQTLPMLYQLPAGDFHDITSGDNGFAAGAGYDLVTGLGSPQASLLIGGLIGSSISGTVFADANNNGIHENGEVGLSGWTVFDDLNNDGAFTPAVQAGIDSADVPKPIPDLTTITSSVTVFGFSGSIGDLNVNLTLHHTFDRDLIITLFAPDGTNVVLANRNGGSSDNFINTTFDDQAATRISSGSAPFTGTFHPTGSLAVLNGKDPNGIWTLQIADVRGIDNGTLNSWSLKITTTGEPSTTTADNGSYSFVNVATGVHHIREVVQGGFLETSPSGGVFEISIAVGANIVGQDFGNALVQATVTSPVPGDFNQDGRLTGDDIPVMLAALADLETYKTNFKLNDDGLLAFGDLDGDHLVTNADVQRLLTMLIGGSGSSLAAPVTTAQSALATAVAIQPSNSLAQSAIDSSNHVGTKASSSLALPPVRFQPNNSDNPCARATVTEVQIKKSDVPVSTLALTTADIHRDASGNRGHRHFRAAPPDDGPTDDVFASW